MIAPLRDRITRFATVGLVATFLIASGAFAADALMNAVGPRLAPAAADGSAEPSDAAGPGSASPTDADDDDETAGPSESPDDEATAEPSETPEASDDHGDDPTPEPSSTPDASDHSGPG